MNAHDETAPFRRRIEDLEARHRYWVSLTCDRCRTSLTLSSATATAMDLEPHLLQVATALGWCLTRETLDGLDPRSPALFPRIITQRDLCLLCYETLFPSKPGEP